MERDGWSGKVQGYGYRGRAAEEIERRERRRI
jgi:hypothetical protein